MTTQTIQTTTTFKKVIVKAKGGPEVIDYVESPMIEPAAGEVRVKVEASDVAFADVQARAGAYPNIPPYPFTPGYDLVGRVDKVGLGVSDFTVGQRVGAFMLHFGGCAEYANVPAEMLIPVPENTDAGEATSLFLNYLTAWRMMHNMAQVKAGDRVLITSAAGGVGTALLQLGQLAGLTMYGTASQGKLALVKELGGIPIDYHNEDFVAHILQDGHKLDAVFEAVAGETISRAYHLVKKGGMLISYGQLSVRGSSLMAFLPSLLRIGWHKIVPDGKQVIFDSGIVPYVEKNKQWYRDTMFELFQLLAEGKVKPIIGRRLPLSDTAQAQKLLEDGAVQGKIVLLAD